MKQKRIVQELFTIMPRQALHAKTLGFVHPVSQEFMKFDSEPPHDMRALLEKVRRPASSP